jgi:hypothetical protein
VARSRRDTTPLETVDGVLTAYSAEIEPKLAEGAFRGLAWVFERAQVAPGSTPSDFDVLELHRAMYGRLFAWAGQTRTADVGPSGFVPVPWRGVPVALRQLAGDVRAWVDAAPAPPKPQDIAEIIADAHHRFQWIHPFQDTNGRTGRVLDAYYLWVTFGLAGSGVLSSVSIEPFPTEEAEDEYYEGLIEADVGRPDRLRRYYVARLEEAFGRRT